MHDKLMAHLQGVFSAQGVTPVAEYFKETLEEDGAPEEVTYLRLRACLMAEGLPTPTTPFLSALMEEVRNLEPDMTQERHTVCHRITAMLGVEICNTALATAMEAAHEVAGLLGATITIVEHRTDEGFRPHNYSGFMH